MSEIDHLPDPPEQGHIDFLMTMCSDVDVAIKLCDFFNTVLEFGKNTNDAIMTSVCIVEYYFENVDTYVCGYEVTAGVVDPETKTIIGGVDLIKNVRFLPVQKKHIVAVLPASKRH